MKHQLILLSEEEFQRRLSRVRAAMREINADLALITDYANTYYLTGRVFTGIIAILESGKVYFFVRRPVGLTGESVIEIRKPEDILSVPEIAGAAKVALEMDITSYSSIERMKAMFPTAGFLNFSPAMRQVRSVKTEAEIELMRSSGISHTHVYSHIPKMYQEGMTDIELQVAVERMARLEGCLGEFRISGDSMELYMGSVLTGENADNPSPYDFAMGGGGINPSLPVGANGSVISRGNTVMVDMNGDFTGYMTDMTRVFALGEISDLAAKAHDCSRKICRRFEEIARPGVPAKEIYEMAAGMAREAGLEGYFMGHRQKAGFVGHGLGIEINELPVLAPRSRDILQTGNVIAIEPKFVIPHVGAVGIENTYVIYPDHVECLTNAPEEIISLN